MNWRSWRRMWKGETFPLKRPEKYYYWCVFCCLRRDALLLNKFLKHKRQKSHNNQKLESTVFLESTLFQCLTTRRTTFQQKCFVVFEPFFQTSKFNIFLTCQISFDDKRKSFSFLLSLMLNHRHSYFINKNVYLFRHLQQNNFKYSSMKFLDWSSNPLF